MWTSEGFGFFLSGNFLKFFYSHETLSKRVSYSTALDSKVYFVATIHCFYKDDFYDISETRMTNMDASREDCG